MSKIEWLYPNLVSVGCFEPFKGLAVEEETNVTKLIVTGVGPTFESDKGIKFLSPA